MNLLHKLYLCRFSILAALFLLLFPIAVKGFGLTSAMFGGLFDVDDFGPTFWLSCSAYLLSWSATVTFRITALYGPERVGMGPSKKPRHIETKAASQIIFVVGMLLPLPLLGLVLYAKFSRGAFAGAALGFLAAFALVYAADLVHRLFNTFHGSEEKEDPGTDLFFPFKNRLAQKAERVEPVVRFFKRPVFDRLLRMLWWLPEGWTTGYIRRTPNSVTINPGMIVPLVMFGTFLIVYSIGFYAWVYRRELDLEITTVAYLFVLVTFLCWVFAGIGFFFDRFRIPALLVIVLVWTFSGLNHTYDAGPVPLRNASFPHARPGDFIALRKGHPYIILVTANGGGIQSSAWATEVLTRFDQICPDIDPRKTGCRNAIAAVSGVSGGSVGLMYYMEAFNQDSPRLDENTGERIRSYSRQSSLAFVGGTFVFQDLIRNIPLVSRFIETDRGRRLASGWAENKIRIDVSEGLKPIEGSELTDTPPQDGRVGLNDNFSAWRRGGRPAVIFNSTVVETGQRLLFSTARFSSRDPLKSEWLTLNELCGGDCDIGITEAARLSAAFAYVSPAPHMEDPATELQGYRVVDGGYADNYGLLSLKDFLQEGVNETSFPGPQRPKIIILQLYGEQVERDPKTGEHRPPSGILSWSKQLFAPLSTLLRVRQTGQHARNDETAESIALTLNAKGLTVDRFVFEYPSGDAPLSWHLTGSEKDSIETAGQMIFGTSDLPHDSPHRKNREEWNRLKALLTSQ
jgi:hypothetical protein